MTCILRERLRAETGDRHRRLDAAFGELSLAERADYALFLRAHAGAYGALLRGAEPRTTLALGLGTIRGLLAEDLRGLDAAEPPGIPAPCLRGTLGLRYVIAGSHFGKRVLDRRRARSLDPRVLDAGRYMASPLLREMWRQVLSDLADAGAEGPVADDAVHDADRVFALFQDSLHAARRESAAFAALDRNAARV